MTRRQRRGDALLFILLALSAFPTAESSPQLCPSNLTGSNAAIQLQRRPWFSISWRPYYHLTSPPGGPYIGILQTRCPSFLRTWDLTLADGSHAYTIESTIPLTTTYISSYSALRVRDCNGQMLGTITESYSDFFVNRYGFSAVYDVHDMLGNRIGTTSGNTFGDGYIELTDTTTANGTVIARGSWSWGSLSSSFNLNGATVNIEYYDPSFPAGRWEFVLTIMAAGFYRASERSDSEGYTDSCSEFVFVGVPFLGLINLVVIILLVLKSANKPKALLVGLLFWPLAAVYIAVTFLLLFIALFSGCCSVACDKAGNDALGQRMRGGFDLFFRFAPSPFAIASWANEAGWDWPKLGRRRRTFDASFSMRGGAVSPVAMPEELVASAAAVADDPGTARGAGSARSVDDDGGTEAQRGAAIAVDPADSISTYASATAANAALAPVPAAVGDSWGHNPVAGSPAAAPTESAPASGGFSSRVML